MLVLVYVVLCVMLPGLLAALFLPKLSFLFWMLYAATYFSRPDRTGYWRLNWVRSLAVWDWLGGGACRMQNARLLEEVQSTDRLLFVVAPNTTMIPLFWVFGLHGQSVLQGLDVVYAVPRFLLLIPGLREILMISGAVADDETTIKTRLLKGDSVVMCPSGARAPLYTQVTSESRVEEFSDDWAGFCINNGVKVAPVVFMGETARYQITRSSTLYQLQRTMHREIGYAMPVVFRYDPRYPVFTTISVPIDARNYSAAGASEPHQTTELRKAIESGWRGIANTGQHTLTIIRHSPVPNGSSSTDEIV